MDHTTIETLAATYIEREKDSFFAQEVRQLLAQKNWKELEDRFYKELEFGTGGLRGIIGGGFNRMNTYIVSRATQGLSTYLKEAFPGKKLSACIAYDSRKYSKEFALHSALVFAGNGIKAYVFSAVRPTPLLSYAIRALKADTGIVVTASHNPPAYNGYKAYWYDGSQVVPPHDVGIIERVESVGTIHTMSEQEAIDEGLLRYIDKEIDEPYVALIKEKLLRKDLLKSRSDQSRIVYTPLHGTGAMLFERIMGDLGVTYFTVPEQREPDGTFPTVSFPNPEEGAALAMAIELGKAKHADVVMATDPDADRLGIAVPRDHNEYALITGNMLGALHVDYMFLTLKEFGKLPSKPVIIKSIVTSNLLSKIASAYGGECWECLTGFKWIAEMMRKIEASAQGYQFVYGTEESYGHLIENEVRDKDGISAAAFTAEMAMYWQSKGVSLLERLDELYIKHGYHEEKGINAYFEGPKGMDKMSGILESLRATQPVSLGGIAISKIRDIKTGLEWDVGKNALKRKVDLPSSNVIQWSLEDGTVVTVRPSGTEPKIKFYILLCTPVKDKNSLALAKSASSDKASKIESDLRKMLE